MKLLTNNKNERSRQPLSAYYHFYRNNSKKLTHSLLTTLIFSLILLFAISCASGFELMQSTSYKRQIKGMEEVTKYPRLTKPVIKLLIDSLASPNDQVKQKALDVLLSDKYKDYRLYNNYVFVKNTLLNFSSFRDVQQNELLCFSRHFQTCNVVTSDIAISILADNQQPHKKRIFACKVLYPGIAKLDLSQQEKVMPYFFNVLAGFEDSGITINQSNKISQINIDNSESVSMEYLFKFVGGSREEFLKSYALERIETIWDPSVEDFCVKVCHKDIESASCQNISLIANKMNSTNINFVNEHSFRNCVSIKKIVKRYDTMSKEQFSLMPKDLKLFTNLVVKLYDVNYDWVNIVGSEKMAKFSDLGRKRDRIMFGGIGGLQPELINYYASAAKKSLLMEVEILKELCGGKSGERSGNDLTNKLFFIYSIKEIGLAAVLYGEIKDSALKHRVIEIIDQSDLESSYMIKRTFNVFVDDKKLMRKIKKKYASDVNSPQKIEILAYKAEAQKRLEKKNSIKVTPCGSIIDNLTGLEWYVGPDIRTTWNEAKSWVESLSDCGGGWRMPEIAEVESLYQKGVWTRNMDRAFQTTGWTVWTTQRVSIPLSDRMWNVKHKYKYWGFCFRDGSQRHSTYDNIRAFAVRSWSGQVEIKERQVTLSTSTIGYRMVQIPAGRFLTGFSGDDPCLHHEMTRHWVTISKAFLMGTTEVTQDQWKRVMGSNPSKFKNCGGDCPVENVSWTEAVEFCNRLSDLEGLSRCYNGENWDQSCTGYRLPTEAEWEYSVRAGTTGPFHTGNCLSTSEANYNGNYPLTGCSKGQCRKTPIRVGNLASNSWGLHNMHGNVGEWVWDWYGSYPPGSMTDPVGPGYGSYRGGRGGSWGSRAQNCRSASRGRHSPGFRSSNLGFRLARSLP